MKHSTQLVRMILAATALAAVLAPGTASADLRGTAFAGATRLNETNKGTFGAAVTLGSLIGVEFDASRVPLGTLKEISIAKAEANVTTYMANLVLRAPTGSVQPYASAGVGVVRVTGSVAVPGLGNVVSASAGDVAMNVGGGLYVFPSENLGFRADVRRFQTGDVSWEDIASIGDLPLPKFDFWRATVGVTLKF